MNEKERQRLGKRDKETDKVYVSMGDRKRSRIEKERQRQKVKESREKEKERESWDR